MTDELQRRASDAEREQAVARLREGSAEGRLTLEELAERAALAYRAQSRAELARLTEDLPSATAESSRRKPVRWIGVLIGETKRKGRWRIDGQATLVMGIGNCELDLREAELVGGEVTLKVVQLIGDTTIVVPHRVDVELSGLLLIGSKSDEGPGEEIAPGAPLVRVQVYGLVGEVKVVRA